MLVSGLRASREATELVNRGEDIGAFEERISRGVSANLCQAAANLINSGSGLDVSVRWALTRQPHEDQANERAAVAFVPSDAPVLEEAAPHPQRSTGTVRRANRGLRLRPGP